MLTVKIKNPVTIGKLQGPYEASIANRNTWVEYSYHLDRMVKFFGPDRSPDDVFRQDVANFRAHLVEHHNYPEVRASRAISVGSSYWQWMNDMGFATTNPFLRQRIPYEQREVQVIAV
jgi:site-specific recombinase XerD